MNKIVIVDGGYAVSCGWIADETVGHENRTGIAIAISERGWVLIAVGAHQEGDERIKCARCAVSSTVITEIANVICSSESERIACIASNSTWIAGDAMVNRTWTWFTYT